MGMLDGAISTGGFLLDKALGAPVFSDGAQVVNAGVDMWNNGLTTSNETSMLGGAGKMAIDIARASSKAPLAEEIVPGIGPLIGGVADMAGGIGGMAQHWNDTDNAWFDAAAGGRNQFYGAAGTTALGSLHAGLGLAETAGLGEAGLALLGGVTAPAAIPGLVEAAGAMAIDTALGVGETAVNLGGFGLGLIGSGINKAEGLTGKDAHDWYWGANDVAGLALHGTAAAAEGAFGLMTGEDVGPSGPGLTPTAPSMGPPAPDLFDHFAG